MSSQYSLAVSNNSNFPGDLCLFQHDPNLNDPDLLSLAWFCKYTYPTTTLTFSWTIDYSFIWDNTGTLMPGVVFRSSQDWHADLNLSNQVTLTYDGDHDAFTFKDEVQNPQGGSLFILQDATIPSNRASAGIAMSGSGIHAMQARPNWRLSFTPQPTYWVAFGTFTQGQVLDVTSISNKQLIKFPPGVFSMIATLNSDNTWSVKAG